MKSQSLFLMRSLIDMLGGEMARHGQAGAHGPLGVGRDDADAGAGRFVDDDRVADVDAELLEFLGIEQAVAIVADAADERRGAAELRERNDGVGDGERARNNELWDEIQDVPLCFSVIICFSVITLSP